MPPVQQQTPTPTPQMSQRPTNSHIVMYLWIAAAVAIVLVGVLVAFLRLTGANADYICTKVVNNSDGVCTNGSWGQWQVVSDASEGNTTTTVQERTYTGTRAVSVTLQYLNLRSACQAGYTQQGYGSGGGASGFHGGSVQTTYSACQLVQTRTVTKTQGTGSGGTRVQTGYDQTDVGEQTTETKSVGSVAELESHNPDSSQSFTDGESTLDIAAKPALVRSGDTTSVEWTALGVSSCTVTGSNGDAWTGLTGTFASKPIFSATTYTLRCLLDGTDELSATATVIPAPIFQEL